VIHPTSVYSFGSRRVWSAEYLHQPFRAKHAVQKRGDGLGISSGDALRVSVKHDGRAILRALEDWTSWFAAVAVSFQGDL